MSDFFSSHLAKVREGLQPARVWPKILLTSVVTLVAILTVLFFVSSTYIEYFRGSVYPGVFVNNYPAGGLTTKGLQDFIENVNNRYSKEGIDLAVSDARGTEHRVKLNTVIAGDSTGELLRLDSVHVAAQAFAAGRQKGFWASHFLPFYYRFFNPAHIAVPVISNDTALIEVLQNILSPFEDSPHNAGVIFPNSDTYTYTIVPERMGQKFDQVAVLSKIKQTLARLSFQPVALAPVSFSPTVVASDVQKIAAKLSAIFAYGPLGLTYVDTQTKLRRDWSVPSARVSSWLEVRKDTDGNFIFALSKAGVQDYLDKEVRSTVEVPAEDAKFIVDNAKVKEFQASRSGVSLDLDKTYEDFDAAFRERNYAPERPVLTVNVTTDIADPKIKTADVNSLGITDVIGVGFSTFKDSHTNRIKNIANAVKRLNGTLIKPGEEFSALKFAGPFTTANGFLPEAVIKGNEIKNEVGGGMCQIGTTLFRMAMNSGMNITARRNHSLVVSYYADPVNKNPGTDATLYEPMLDLKFLNDTGNYLLLQTDINYTRQMLTFTLWGKPDGRSGSYTHPLVSKWIPAGEPQEIIVTDGTLKPGVQKCQAAFRGAVASFTYTRVTPAGETINRVFDSYYRPLPKICMTGAVVAATSTPAVVGPIDLSEPVAQ